MKIASLIAKDKKMTEQEMHQIWFAFNRYGTDLESCDAECMDEEAFIQALSEAAQIIRNQALEEAAVICDQLASGFAIEGMAMQRIGALDCSFTIRDRKIN